METRARGQSSIECAQECGAGQCRKFRGGSIPTQRPTVDLTALTDRDDFLLELGEALGGQASVNPVDSIDTAIGQLASTKRGQMLVIDARATDDVRAVVQRATQQAPNAVVVVFADTDSEKRIASRSEGHECLCGADDSDRGGEDGGGAGCRHHRCHEPKRRRPWLGYERAGAPVAPTLDSFRPAMSHSAAKESEEPGEGGRTGPLWAGLGLAVAALAAGGAWYFTTHGKITSGVVAPQASGTIASHAATASETAAALPQPAVDTSIVAGQVDDLLEKARLALRDRRYTAPTGDNALVYYRSALAADPANGEAKDGLRRVGDVLISRFNDSISGAHYSDAALALASLKLVAPSDSHIGPFQVQLSAAEITAALASGNADRAAALVRQAQQSGDVPAAQQATWRTQLAHLQQADKVQSLASLVLDRIRSDQLTGPAGDSAESYLGELRAAAPSAPATERAASALVDAFLNKARQNALSGDSTDEDRWVAAARANGASAADVAAFQRDVASAQAKTAHAKAESLASLVRQRLSSGALTSPAGDSAADYLQQLEGSHPTGSAQAVAMQARSTLAAALIARARAEMRSSETAPANADLAAATSWGASAAAVAAVRRLGSASQAQSQAAAGPDLQALAQQLQRTRYVAPEYPDRALTDRISGSVTVQYIVDKQGRTRDVKIVESAPRGVFDGAAIDAIGRWRYRPAHYNGQPVEVPVRTRIRFELPN